MVSFQTTAVIEKSDIASQKSNFEYHLVDGIEEEREVEIHGNRNFYSQDFVLFHFYIKGFITSALACPLALALHLYSLRLRHDVISSQAQDTNASGLDNHCASIITLGVSMCIILLAVLLKCSKIFASKESHNTDQNLVDEIINKESLNTNQNLVDEITIEESQNTDQNFLDEIMYDSVINDTESKQKSNFFLNGSDWGHFIGMSMGSITSTLIILSAIDRIIKDDTMKEEAIRTLSFTLSSGLSIFVFFVVPSVILTIVFKKSSVTSKDKEVLNNNAVQSEILVV